MTATTHYMDAKQQARAKATEVGLASAIRLIYRIVGLVFMFVALGIWLAPGANWAAEIVLLKVGVSFFFAVTGLTFVNASSKPEAPAPADAMTSDAIANGSETQPTES